MNLKLEMLTTVSLTDTVIRDPFSPLKVCRNKYSQILANCHFNIFANLLKISSISQTISKLKYLNNLKKNSRLLKFFGEPFFSFATTSTRQRSRKKTRKKTKNVKASTSKWTSDNEYRHYAITNNLPFSGLKTWFCCRGGVVACPALV